MKAVRNERGISLVEVLAGVTVFAIVAAGIAAGTVSTIKGNSASRTTTAAAALIHDKVEQLRSLDPAGNPADLAAGTHNDPLNPMNEVGQQGGLFARSWTVTANSPRLGLSEVVVTVTWKDPVPRTLRSATYICRTTTCS